MPEVVAQAFVIRITVHEKQAILLDLTEDEVLEQPDSVSHQKSSTQKVLLKTVRRKAIILHNVL